MSIIGRISYIKLARTNPVTLQQSCSISFTSVKGTFTNRKALVTGLGIATGGLGVLIYSLDKSVQAWAWEFHPPKFDWDHKKFFRALDHASIRRGFEVYRNVCSACHGLQFLPYRRMIDVCHTEDELKEIAAEVQIKDGPNDVGEYYMRPGKLSDYIPSPYPNDKAAAHANNGAIPPDLSLIVMARGGEDEVFSILTGYTEAPAGVQLTESAHYNPYKFGSLIAMAPPLYNGVMEYSDGTPATTSQLAKDVVTFLTWVVQPEYDKRMLYSIKVILLGLFLIPPVVYFCRHKWTPILSRKVIPYRTSSKKK